MYLLRLLPGPEAVQSDHDLWRYFAGCVLLLLLVVLYILETNKHGSR